MPAACLTTRQDAGLPPRRDTRVRWPTSSPARSKRSPSQPFKPMRTFSRSSRTPAESLGEAIEAEVVSHSLLAAVASLADLYGDDAGRLIEQAPEPIPSIPPPASTRRHAPLAQYLSLLLIDELDWSAGEQAVDRLATEVREERRADLAELRRLVSGDDYWRFATWESIGAHRLFITAPHGGDGADVAVSIGRLGRDGVLQLLARPRGHCPTPTLTGP